MIRRRSGLMAVLLLTVASWRGDAALAGEPGTDQVRRAAEQAVRLIEASTREYPDHRDCFSCHHQGVPPFAMTLAKTRGLAVDRENLGSILELTREDLKRASADYRSGQGQPGGVTRAGYALFALESGEWKADETTSDVAGFLLTRNREDASWKTSSNRPPSEASTFTSTFLAIRGLRAYGKGQDDGRVAARIDKARDWLEKNPGSDTEDRAFRLWALKVASSGAGSLHDAADRLLKSQRPDGGWSQLDRPDAASDSYATGLALVALHLGGGLSTEDPAYRRGLVFLIKSQLPDGSWHVHSRSKPFQPYFESGFPHGKDQFISIAASSWAASALILGLPTSAH